MEKKGAILIKILAVLAVIFFFIGQQGYTMIRSFNHLWDIGHIFSFGIFTYIFYLYKGQHKSFIELTILTTLFTMIAGGGVEIIQAVFLDRFFDIYDFFRNFLGSFITLFFLTQQRYSISKTLLKTGQTIIAALIILSLMPLTNALIDEWRARKLFPLLSDFERAVELQRWEVNGEMELSSEICFKGIHSLELGLKTTRHSGIILKHFPRDWSGYQYFEFQVYNPDTSQLKIKCTIHDKNDLKDKYHSNCFKKSIFISKGWNHIKINLDEISSIPERQHTDMTFISDVQIYVSRLDKPRTIYLDEVRLSN